MAEPTIFQANKIGLESLPAEMQLEIMGYIDDIQDIGSLIRASKTYFETFSCYSESVFKDVFCNQMSEPALRRAYAAVAVSNLDASVDTLSESVSLRKWNSFVRKYCAVGEKSDGDGRGSFKITKRMANAIYANHKAVEGLTNVFCENMLEVSPLTGALQLDDDKEFTASEKHRIYRAFYFVWLFHSLFPQSYANQKDFYTRFIESIDGHISTNSEVVAHAELRKDFEIAHPLNSEDNHSKSDKQINSLRTKAEMVVLKALSLWERQEAIAALKFLMAKIRPFLCRDHFDCQCDGVVYAKSVPSEEVLLAAEGRYVRKLMADKYHNYPTFFNHTMASVLLQNGLKALADYTCRLSREQQRDVRKKTFLCNDRGCLITDYVRPLPREIDNLEEAPPRITPLISRIDRLDEYDARLLKIYPLKCVCASDGRDIDIDKNWVAQSDVRPSYCIWDDKRLEVWGFNYRS